MADGSGYINGDTITLDGGEWLRSGGEFSGLMEMDRDLLKGDVAADENSR